MFRRALCLGLVGLTLCSVPASADSGSPRRARTTATSSTKRVVWTLVGIGAGFGAGLFIGLHAFDDAIDSDRKVWTSAIVGAAAGGVAAGLLSRNIGRAPQVSFPLPARRFQLQPPASTVKIQLPASSFTLPALDESPKPSLAR